MADKQPILDLDELLTGQTVRFAGADYPMRTLEGLDLTRAAEVSAQGRRLGHLLKRIDKLTPREQKTLTHELDRFCRAVVDAPDAVHRKLTDKQRVAVMQVFLGLPPTILTVGARPTTRRSTGATSSRGSRASTAGRQATGSPVSPSPSSAPISG